VIWLPIVAALAVGYALGRARPYDRLADWTNWQLRFRLDRWTTRPRQVALFALLLATDPVRTASAWRHRKEPKPERAPALKFRRPDGDAP
jgi:hypothetical protein